MAKKIKDAAKKVKKSEKPKKEKVTLAGLDGKFDHLEACYDEDLTSVYERVQKMEEYLTTLEQRLAALEKRLGTSAEPVGVIDDPNAAPVNPLVSDDPFNKQP